MDRGRLFQLLVPALVLVSTAALAAVEQQQQKPVDPVRIIGVTPARILPGETMLITLSALPQAPRVACQGRPSRKALRNQGSAFHAQEFLR